MTKDEILAEIQRAATKNGGKPLGAGRLKQEAGIDVSDWSKYWIRFTEAQREAGFEPNKLTEAYTDEYLLSRMADLTRELNHYPVRNELRHKRRTDVTFPAYTVFRRLGTRDDLIRKVLQFCRENKGYAKAIVLLQPLADVLPSPKHGDGDISIKDEGYGFVYLVKGHPGEYKIGRTNLVDRRLSELGATASIEQTLIHEIKTDDAAGIEHYWHKRFAEKRMRGEWFKLNADDVRKFKRWRHIF